MMVLFSQGFRAFFDDVFGNVQFHGKVGVHALHLAGVHAPVTLPPFIQRGAAYAVHTRQFVDAFARLIAPKKPAGFFIIILKGLVLLILEVTKDGARIYYYNDTIKMAFCRSVWSDTFKIELAHPSLTE